MAQEQEQEFFYPDFFVTPRVIWLDTNIPPMGEKVYSVIHWYSRLKDGYCHASNATIAKNIGGTNAKSVGNAIAKLIEAGYIHAEYSESGHRTVLYPLIEYAVVNPPSNSGGYPSNDGGGIHQMMEHNKNNKKNINTIVDFSKPIEDEVHRLYKGWLVEMVIGARKWMLSTEDQYVSLLEAAAKKCKLTPKRYTKISARLKTMEYSVCATAIRNIAKSEFHRGENENKWTASIEWLFNSDEKIEEWGNK